MNGKLSSGRIVVVCAVAFLTGMLLGHWNPLFNPNCGLDSGADSDLVTTHLLTASPSSASAATTIVPSGLIAAEAHLHDVANCGVVRKKRGELVYHVDTQKKKKKKNTPFLFLF